MDQRRILPGGETLPSERNMLNDWEDILAHVQAALARRRKAYPQLVADGKMAGDAAQGDIAAWEALVQEWWWICTGQGEPPHFSTLFDRIAAVDRALERVAAALRQNPRSEDLRHQQDMNLCLRWHLSQLRFGDPEIHFWTRLNHSIRRGNGTAFPVCPTCELRREDPVRRACTRTDCPTIRPEQPASAPAERIAA